VRHAGCSEVDSPCTFLTPNADDVPEISDPCREEVYQYIVKKATNINLNVPLGELLLPRQL